MRSTGQLASAGERSLPLTLLILLFVFGSIVAAGVPLLLALSGVVGTIGLIALPSHLVPMDPNVSAVAAARRPGGRGRLLALLSQA